MPFKFIYLQSKTKLAIKNPSICFALENSAFLLHQDVDPHPNFIFMIYSLHCNLSAALLLLSDVALGPPWLT